MFHAYRYNGTYEVTLWVEDVGGNKAHTTKTVTVVEGEERPALKSSGPGSSSPPGASGSSAGGTAGAGTTGAAAGPLPRPAATATILSRSLKRVLAGGLSVRYSVNQQMTGRFEVLLAASIAQRIGLHGPPATGLARAHLLRS